MNTFIGRVTFNLYFMNTLISIWAVSSKKINSKLSLLKPCSITIFSWSSTFSPVSVWNTGSNILGLKSVCCLLASDLSCNNALLNEYNNQYNPLMIQTDNLKPVLRKRALDQILNYNIVQVMAYHLKFSILWDFEKIYNLHVSWFLSCLIFISHYRYDSTYTSLLFTKNYLERHNNQEHCRLTEGNTMLNTCR